LDEAANKLSALKTAAGPRFREKEHPCQVEIVQRRVVKDSVELAAILLMWQQPKSVTRDLMTSSRIAVVHEDPRTALTLTSAFAAAGYQAIGALTFREALVGLGGYRPAVLVVTCDAGADNGLDAALRAAAESPQIKIVVVGRRSASVEGESHDFDQTPCVPASLDAFVAQAPTATLN
jgi:hypothetical protein